jgi:hypothetical protein
MLVTDTYFMSQVGELKLNWVDQTPLFFSFGLMQEILVYIQFVNFKHVMSPFLCIKLYIFVCKLQN